MAMRVALVLFGAEGFGTKIKTTAEAVEPCQSDWLTISCTIVDRSGVCCAVPLLLCHSRGCHCTAAVVRLRNEMDVWDVPSAVGEAVRSPYTISDTLPRIDMFAAAPSCRVHAVIMDPAGTLMPVKRSATMLLVVLPLMRGKGRCAAVDSAWV